MVQDALLPTWFRVGGGARLLATPSTRAHLEQCLGIDPKLRILGDGANLLVADEGVDNLVVSLASMNEVTIEGALVKVGAGVNLPRLITRLVREGLGGLESLGGIPASIGGALVMNAGGTFGEIATSVVSVEVMGRDGQARTLKRAEIDFGYRRSGLTNDIILGAHLQLTSSDPIALRDRLKEVMAYKKASQPMADNSAGCCFKNPTLAIDHPEFGPAGTRVSAGKLIDRAQCKGLRIGSAEVSRAHGNFLTADAGGRAADVIALIAEVTRRVRDAFAIELHPEVVIWYRGGGG